MSVDDTQAIERLKRAYAAFNRGDFDTAVAESRLDPDFEFIRFGNQSPIRGARAYREWMEPDAIETQTIEPQQFHQVGAKVLVFQHAWGRGAGSGIELTLDTWGVWTFGQSGHATRLEAFLLEDAEAARRAAGLPPAP